MDKNKAQPIVGVILLVLSVLLVVGVQTFAAPCGAHDDGTVSSCYWAGRAVFGVGIVSAVLSVIRVLERDEGERRGLSLAIANLGALAACMPGLLIDLCMMQTMRCHTIMRPFVLAVGAALALVGAVDVIVRLVRRRQA